jgi:hypothetical protein
MIDVAAGPRQLAVVEKDSALTKSFRQVESQPPFAVGPVRPGAGGLGIVSDETDDRSQMLRRRRFIVSSGTSTR